MIVGGTLSTDSKAPGANNIVEQQIRPPQPKWSSKFKWIGGLVLVLSLIAGTTVVLAIYFFQTAPPPPSQVFLITVENNERQQLPMEVRLDQQNKTEFIISPIMDENSTESILIFRDYNKGITAHKDPIAKTCFIGKLESEIEDRMESLRRVKEKRKFNPSYFVDSNLQS